MSPPLKRSGVGDMPFSQTSLLVVQPTPFCNIDCSYCYLPDRSSKKRLSFELAQVIFRKLLRFPTVRELVTVVWHAGEPLVLPVKYYEQMFQLIKDLSPPGLHVRHSFQTNGTLISDAWCELIQKWNINIGVSIDGPAELHDLHRKQRNGAGSFNLTHEGLRRLQRAGIPFHVISVLTVESMAKLEQMLDFYVDNAIEYICFNIEEQEGLNSRSRFVNSAAADARYRSFLERFLDLSFQRQQPVLVREVESSMRAIQGHGAEIRNEQAEPFRIISVDSDGNVSTFSPELLGLKHERYDFCFGNLRDLEFEQIAARVMESSLYADIGAGLQQCASTCAYYGVCGGGAPANKIFENGSAASTETVHCRSLMRSVDVVLDLIDRLPPDLSTRWVAHQTQGASSAAPLHPIF
ncbi:MAG: GRRM system radical SAM/SPASM domain protein [Xanthobacteraceae bacterium]|nr:GRRM system radical SAM/SPASM domain protein [Xanthobacteraceae bacterium]